MGMGGHGHCLKLSAGFAQKHPRVLLRLILLVRREPETHWVAQTQPQD